jgi:transmembrane sensor
MSLSFFDARPGQPAPLGHSDDERRAIHEAAQWFVRLQGEGGGLGADIDAATDAGADSDSNSASRPSAHAPLNDACRRQWQAWLAQHPAHPWAWSRVEQVCHQFRQVPGPVAGKALGTLPARRSVLAGLVLLASAGALGLGAYQAVGPEQRGMRYQTARGERRELRLADGSRITLNGGSDLRVDFDGERRQLHLLAGEMLVSTHADDREPARPFGVTTPQGDVRALGTRFSIRLEDDHALVAVQEKAVMLSPASGRALRLEAGQQSRLYGTAATLPVPAESHLVSWQQGYLVVVDMPLRRFLAELGRYHPGYLGCDDAVADLRVFGAFPLQQLDESLAALMEVYPLARRQLTRYWNRLERLDTPGRA